MSENDIMDRISAGRQRRSLPILCLDFDGVIHSYVSGWQGAAIVPDPPVPGAVEFLHAAVERFRVAIYSSRSGQPGGLDAMVGWLTMQVMAAIEDRREAEHVLGLIEWPNEKPAALITLDDRALTFTGIWPSLDDLAAFQPWNKLKADREPSPVEKAYGALWCDSVNPNARSTHARRLLLDLIGKDGQRRGIAWAQQQFGAPTEAEIRAMDVGLPTPAVETKLTLDRAAACRAAEAACRRYGQWVPQQWLDLFMEEYAATPSIEPARA